MAIGKATAHKAMKTAADAATSSMDCCNGCQVSSGNSGRSNSPSPPLSPRRRSHARRRVRPRLSPTSGSGVLSRRRVRYMVVLPLLYFSGLLMCVGPFSSFVSFLSSSPGSVYRSHQIFEKLWPEIRSDNSSSVQLQSLWTYSYKRRLKEQKPCYGSQQFVIDGEAIKRSGYLIVEANGGLNQQRSAICNAVALAGLLNAILVIPRFEFNSVWKDPSEFGDIYDEDHFISTLDGYVKVVRELPDVLKERFHFNDSNIPTIRVEAWSTAKYYLREVYPVLREQGVIRITPFANRLAMNVPPQIQLLRCLANYKALRFSPKILTLAKTLVDRMINNSSRTEGRYMAVHLRFEEDMVAFSCCEYDGGKIEKAELDLIRGKRWGKTFKKKNRSIVPGLIRAEGKCPLTPLEVGMMLRGMGFDNTTSIFLASGKIYHADRYMSPLLKMFPLVYNKESLATKEELAPFMGYSSRLAALDYMVALASEVFVTTHGGNFPHFLMGHRRFIYGGHSKTINPDKQKLVLLLQNLGVSWNTIKPQMEAMLRENDRKGKIVPRVKKFNRKTSIYTFPFPECRCLEQQQLQNPDTLFSQVTSSSSR